MASLNPPVCNFGWQAPDFNMLGVDGKRYNLQSSRGEHGLLVVFISNHCPYVQAILPRLVADVAALQVLGINTIAIASNDVINYPADNYEHMQKVALDFNFSFPYVLDYTQEIAKSFDAICTPDFFGFNADLQLQYRGRFDESRKEVSVESTRDLFRAMQLIAKTGKGPDEQIASIGCSIKWK
ncbi:MAG: thioredoxin family protein [Methylophilaceae bacterium]|nr:thioredoxin family protein [Methylophilaceae bacterium]